MKIFKGDSVLDFYAQSIAYYRQASFDKALKVIDLLLNKEPENPFFWELKGQILFDSGNIQKSVEPYRKAVFLLPESALLRISLAQSLLKSTDGVGTKEALEHLQKALQFEKTMAWLGTIWQLLMANKTKCQKWRLLWRNGLFDE